MLLCDVGVSCGADSINWPLPFAVCAESSWSNHCTTPVASQDCDPLPLHFQLSLWYMLDHCTTANVLPSQWFTTFCHQHSWAQAESVWVCECVEEVVVSFRFSKVWSIIICDTWYTVCPNPGFLYFYNNERVKKTGQKDSENYLWSNLAVPVCLN